MDKLDVEAQKPVVAWLTLVGLMVFCMIIVGGATRLTHSGLSIVEWEPLVGTIPPLDQEDWDEVFDEYKTSPEYQQVNFGMSLDEFKVIFWWEYFHRLLGRLIGLVFFIPLLYFAIRRKINGSLAKRLFGIFVLGGLQGGMGWYMVASGLVDDPRVSQYRLTAHLGIAFLIFGAIVWTALSVMYPSKTNTSKPVRRMFRFAVAINVIIFLMVVSGGFVAGIRAGLAYNTWPLMGNSFVPPDIFILTPGWRNFFENMATVQFDHRIIAYVLAVLVPIFWFKVRRRDVSPQTVIATNTLLVLVFTQIVVGISTLLHHVPVTLGVAHQGIGSLVFVTSLWVTHSLISRRGIL
jgi:cytochrome c oxidase assembly protein subunit 15